MLKCYSEKCTNQPAQPPYHNIWAGSNRDPNHECHIHMPECKLLFKGPQTPAANCPAAALISPIMKWHNNADSHYKEENNCKSLSFLTDCTGKKTLRNKCEEAETDFK